MSGRLSPLAPPPAAKIPRRFRPNAATDFGAAPTLFIWEFVERHEERRNTGHLVLESHGYARNHLMTSNGQQRDIIERTKNNPSQLQGQAGTPNEAPCGIPDTTILLERVWLHNHIAFFDSKLVVESPKAGRPEFGDKSISRFTTTRGYIHAFSRFAAIPLCLTAEDHATAAFMRFFTWSSPLHPAPVAAPLLVHPAATPPPLNLLLSP